MNRTLRLFLLAAFFMALLSALRLDIFRYRMERGYASYQRGEMDASLAYWSRLGSRAEGAFNRGVAQFRKGDPARAAGEFRNAAASDDLSLRQRSLYNLGTALLESGNNKIPKEPEQAHRDLEAATAALQGALRLDPGDGAARQNEAIARSRLAEVTLRLADKRGEKGKSIASRPDNNGDNRGDNSRKGEQSDKPGRPGKPDNEGNGKGEARPAPAMTRDQADRLLNDARGREALRSSTAAGAKSSETTPPEKDW